MRERGRKREEGEENNCDWARPKYKPQTLATKLSLANFMLAHVCECTCVLSCVHVCVCECERVGHRLIMIVGERGREFVAHSLAYN